MHAIGALFFIFMFSPQSIWKGEELIWMVSGGKKEVFLIVDFRCSFLYKQSGEAIFVIMLYVFNCLGHKGLSLIGGNLGNYIDLVYMRLAK